MGWRGGKRQREDRKWKEERRVEKLMAGSFLMKGFFLLALDGFVSPEPALCHNSALNITSIRSYLPVNMLLFTYNCLPAY